MKLCETMICWHPLTKRPVRDPRVKWWHPAWLTKRPVPDPLVKCGPHPDRHGWSKPYPMSDGACGHWPEGGGDVDDKGWREVSDDERLLRLFVMFAIMITRDGVPPAEVHKAFLEIDEYREALQLDARLKRVLAAILDPSRRPEPTRLYPTLAQTSDAIDLEPPVVVRLADLRRARP